MEKATKQIATKWHGLLAPRWLCLLGMAMHLEACCCGEIINSVLVENTRIKCQ